MFRSSGRKNPPIELNAHAPLSIIRAAFLRPVLRGIACSDSGLAARGDIGCLGGAVSLGVSRRRQIGAPRGLPQTVSALAAGMACIVPAGLYAWRARVERSAARFLLQGVLKFALTLVLVAAFIILMKPAAAGFFGTFVLLQAMYVVAPLTERQARP